MSYFWGPEEMDETVGKTTQMGTTDRDFTALIFSL
jgi:hypothetical protein